MPAPTRYARLVAAGLCVRCGVRPVEVPTMHCAICLAAMRARSQRHMAEIREASWNARGPNQVACCGAWHDLCEVPWQCPQCGRMYFGEGG